MEPVRWGILSTARIGPAFIRGIGLTMDSCVQAVASREYTRALEWAKTHGIPRVFGSYEELLASREVDAIYNPLPNSLHAEWTIRALEAGYPVLCEKPLTANVAEARAVAAAARQTGRLAVEAFMYRFHPVYDRIFGLIEDGALGRLISIRTVFSFPLNDPNNIRKSGPLAGGALRDLGCYCVSLSRWVAGSEPLRVHAVERRSSVDDTLAGQLEFPEGFVAQFECSFETPDRRGAEIVGTEGIISLADPWTPGEDQAQFTLRRHDHEETLVTPGANPYALEIEDFVRALHAREAPRWPIEDAVANIATLDALYASARRGVTVPVEP